MTTKNYTTPRSLAAAMSAAMATLALPLSQELVVDLFAGGGGASTGIAVAYREPDVAVNHSVAAIAAHEVNHPSTLHFRCDVWEVDPVAATGGRPVGLLWASPDCRHFSKAKGSKPVSDSVRSLADVAVKWAAATAPRVIMLENVEEFTTWGPTIKGADGKSYPCPLSKGLEFKRWVRELEQLGYRVEHRELRACDYGTPTIRKRLFVVARRDGEPIIWPAPTHGKPADPRVLAGELKPYRTAAECIDWSLPVCSIFASPAEAREWARQHGVPSPLRPLKRNTLRRVAKGVLRHVIDTPTPYLVPLRGTSYAHHSTHSVATPAATVSAGGQHHALAIPFVAPNNENNVPVAVDTPVPTVTGGRRNMLVEATLIAPHLTECANASTERVFAADEPMRTQCAQVKGGHFALVAPTLVELAHGEESPSGAKRWGHGSREVDAPIGTVHAGGGNFAVAAPVLMHVNHQGERAGQPVDFPLNTVTAAPRGEQAVAVPVLVGVGGRAGQSEPRRADAPYHTTTSKADSAVVVAHIAKFRGNSVGTDAANPLPTVTAGGQMVRPAGAAHALGAVVACLEQANGGHESPAKAPGEPMTTILGTGSQQRLVTAHIVKYCGNERDGVSLYDPMHVVPTRDRMALVETVQLRVDMLTPEQWCTARAAAALLREFAPERFPVADGEPVPEIVMIGDYILVDIGLRMLKPRELARAQGFADSYELAPTITATDKRGRTRVRRLTATEQVKLIGNSVCPQVATALVAANLKSLIAMYQHQARAA